MAHRSMRMLVYLSCLFTCQLRDLYRNFPRSTPPPTDNCFFFRAVKKILITAIPENSSFLAKSLHKWSLFCVKQIITVFTFCSYLLLMMTIFSLSSTIRSLIVPHVLPDSRYLPPLCLSIPHSMSITLDHYHGLSITIPVVSLPLIVTDLCTLRIRPYLLRNSTQNTEIRIC